MVSLKIYDIGGRMVRTVFADQPFPSGPHAVDLFADDLSSGTYFYRLSTDHDVIVRKMTVLK